MQLNELANVLNQLLVSEYEAIYYYFITSRFIQGKDFDIIVKHFDDHIEEEEKHVDWLIEILQQSGLAVVTDPAELIKGFSVTRRISDLSTNNLIELNQQLESSAIENYSKAYKDTEKDFPVVADRLMDILHDEKEHQHELNKMLEQRTAQNLFSTNSDFAEAMNKQRLFTANKNAWVDYINANGTKDDLIKRLFAAVSDDDKTKFLEICKTKFNTSPDNVDDELTDMEKSEKEKLFIQLLKLNYKEPPDNSLNVAANQFIDKTKLIQFAKILAEKKFKTIPVNFSIKELVDTAIMDSDGTMISATKNVVRSFPE